MCRLVEVYKNDAWILFFEVASQSRRGGLYGGTGRTEHGGREWIRLFNGKVVALAGPQYTGKRG